MSKPNGKACIKEKERMKMVLLLNLKYHSLVKVNERNSKTYTRQFLETCPHIHAWEGSVSHATPYLVEDKEDKERESH